MKKLLGLLFLALVCSLFIMAKGSKTYILREGKDGTSVLSKWGTQFGFFMPETGGYFQTGIILGEKSLWLQDASDCKVERLKNGWVVRVTDPILGGGVLRMQVLPLSNSNGLIMEVQGENLPDGLQFLWAYGGCSADSLSSEKESFFLPESCRDNVFSREINAFTVYYGPSMRLKVMMGVAPLNTTTRLSDARQMSTPLAYWNSGKKTNAPALSALNPIKSGEKYYYCIYRQNTEADYNYYMLPSVFEKELSTKTINKNEKVTPHSGFGPDFHQ